MGGRYEKKGFLICLVFCLFFFSGCATGKDVYNHRIGAGAVRDDMYQLADKQTELAITGTELASDITGSQESVTEIRNKITESEGQLGNIKQTITDGTSDLEEFKTILRRIRNRSTKRTE